MLAYSGFYFVFFNYVYFMFNMVNGFMSRLTYRVPKTGYCILTFESATGIIKHLSLITQRKCIVISGF
jgi:hypothetical protein